jgi:hypothetical protein
VLKIPEDGKLIDAGHLYRYADGEYQAAKVHYGDCEFTRFAENVRDIIGEMAYDLPAIAAKPITYGNWIAHQHDDGYGVYVLFHCSECDCPNANKRNYCPECGAKMK